MNRAGDRFSRSLRLGRGWSLSSLEDGKPVILDRRKLFVGQDFQLYVSPAVSHRRKDGNLAKLQNFVCGVEKESHELALAGIRSCKKNLKNWITNSADAVAARFGRECRSFERFSLRTP